MGYFLCLLIAAANLVLHQTVERIHVGKKYGDIPRGIFVVRGENVVLLGEIVSKQLLLPTGTALVAFVVLWQTPELGIHLSGVKYGRCLIAGAEICSPSRGRFWLNHQEDAPVSLRAGGRGAVPQLLWDGARGKEQHVAWRVGGDVRKPWPVCGIAGGCH